MATKKTDALRKTPATAKMSLQQLMTARRAALFSRMPRMLRGNGELADTLQHEFRYSEAIQTYPSPVSVRRWTLALQFSRILAAQRRRASRAR